MSMRFEKEQDRVILARIDQAKRIAIAAAALDRMRVGYAIWAPEAGGRTPIEDVLHGVWAFVVDGEPLPSMQALERLYPTPADPVTLESPYAESFLEAMQLFTDFARSHDGERLIEIRQAAYNMAFDAAGDSTIQYNAPDYDGRMSPEREERALFHPLVSRELENQARDVEDAATESSLSNLADRLRKRAAAAPVVSHSEFEAMRAFQAQ